MAVKKADQEYLRNPCVAEPKTPVLKKELPKMTDLLGSIGLGTVKPEDARPKTAVDNFVTDCMDKGLPGALKKSATNALWRAKTGIGLNPEVAKALSGPMKAAALMFISSPALANTVAGAELMMQIMANVEGFTALAENK